MKKINWTPRKIILTAITAIFAFFLIWSAGNLVEVVDDDEIVVIQYPTGTVVVHSSPGIKFQWWGKVTRYKKSGTLWFSAKEDEGGSKDNSITVRFNDGAHAKASGSLRFRLPLDEKHMKMLHSQYGSYASVRHDLVWTVTNKSVYMTGPLMSSKESYAESRTDLIDFIGDQVKNGVYKTTKKKEQVEDLVSGKNIWVEKASIKLNEAGLPLRQEGSPLGDFGIEVYNFSITSLNYDPEVEKQIQQQQRAIMEVQTAMAEAKKAEQRTITEAREGEARAAKSKWDQEVIKATEVTKAEQKKAVAKLDKEAAEFWKQEQILKGQGEAQRKKAVMQADGALDKKIAAWVTVNKAYAEQLGKQRWVPNVVIGSGGKGQTGSVGSAQTLMDMYMVKTAKELGLDRSVRTGN